MLNVTLGGKKADQNGQIYQKATKHEKHKTMFPISNNFLNNHHNLRNPEKFVVYSANTQAYKNSFIPYAQRRLNQIHYDGKL